MDGNIVAFEVGGDSRPLLVEEGQGVALEDAEGYTNVTRVALGDSKVLVGWASQSLEKAIQGIIPAARTIVDQFLAIGADVKTVELELGVKLSAEAGAIIAKAAAEGHCVVRLTFTPESTSA